MALDLENYAFIVVVVGRVGVLLAGVPRSERPANLDAKREDKIKGDNKVTSSNHVQRGEYLVSDGLDPTAVGDVERGQPKIILLCHGMWEKVFTGHPQSTLLKIKPGQMGSK
jgi:hypothetical protein